MLCGSDAALVNGLRFRAVAVGRGLREAHRCKRRYSERKSKAEQTFFKRKHDTPPYSIISTFVGKTSCIAGFAPLRPRPPWTNSCATQTSAEPPLFQPR